MLQFARNLHKGYLQTPIDGVFQNLAGHCDKAKTTLSSVLGLILLQTYW